MKIAIGGFHHETNTFASEKAEYQDFVEADGWPALTEGDKLFDAMFTGACIFTIVASAIFGTWALLVTMSL